MQQTLVTEGRWTSHLGLWLDDTHDGAVDPLLNEPCRVHCPLRVSGGSPSHKLRVTTRQGGAQAHEGKGMRVKGIGDPSRRDRGAALIEFALVLPLLLIICLGLVEFGFLFGQLNDVRHGARDASRLAAANVGNVATMGASACNSMDLTSGPTVTFTDSGSGNIGDAAWVQVSAPYTSPTGFGFFDSMMPNTISTRVDIRLEQPSTAWGTGNFVCP